METTPTVLVLNTTGATSTALPSTTATPRIPLFPGNSTLPPEQYRFIPGSTPTFTNKTNSLPIKPSYNGTGYYIEDVEAEAGLNEIQTLFLACFATLLPLIVILATVFSISFCLRILWRRYKRRREFPDYDGVIHRESNSEQPDRPLHAHLLNGDKLGETHLNTDEICDGSITNGIKRNNHSSTNGSIITMTMKNNHLIVETEERNDIEEDSRETTMKYSPSARDGVFVVEVQQGMRRNHNSGGIYSNVIGSSINDQCAIIHNPPNRFGEEETLLESDEKFYPQTTSRPESPDLSGCKTGLSQSNLSLANQSYSYGNQLGYDNGYYGYPNYNGYINDEPLQKLEDRHKPKITSAVYKSLDKESLDLLEADSTLLSDLTLKKDDIDDIQQEQNRLGNSAQFAHLQESAE